MTKYVRTTLSDNEVNSDILNSVLGQLSDGIWENNMSMSKYWINTDIISENGKLVIKILALDYTGFRGMSDKEICRWFANMIVKIVKKELKDSKNDSLDFKKVWRSYNDEIKLDYLSYGSNVTIGDAFYVVDTLKGGKIFL